MKLAGLVVKKSEEEYVSATTGQAVKMYRLYLQAGDPLSGALEVGLNAEQYDNVKEGDLVSFIPSFSTRMWNRNTIVTAKVLDDFSAVAK